MGIFKLFRKTPSIPKPELKRGEYIWKATVYRNKIVRGAEDTPIHAYRFFTYAEANHFRKSLTNVIGQETATIEKMAIADESGWME